jgi:Tol biopolymer transport system component
VALGALLTLAVALALRPPEVPRVTAIRQVTHDRTTKLNVYTDGSRVYYTAAVGGATWLMQAPATGGESVRLETTLRRPRISDIVPDRGELVVEDDQHWFAGEADPVWLVPTVGGSPRSFGEVEGWAGLSADGRHAVYARGRDLLVASGEGLGSRRVLTAPTTILLPRLSPDARRVRYTLESEDWSRPLTRSLWEADVERGTAREILPGWNATGLGWTPDGRSFLFRASRDGEVALWLLPEERRWPWSRSARAPVRLTPGPMEFYASAVSPDGRAVYAVGALPGNAAELVRYDHSAGLFVPFLGGLPASDVAFSRDGRWAAYVLYPEGTLWRSRADGSDRRQLTFAPAQAHLPRWSPDGKTIAYMSQLPGEPWRICLVEAGGGKPRRVATGVSQEMTPDWSRDGTRLVFGGFPPHTPEKPIALSIVDLSTGKVSALPGSEGLYNPLWSPDGQTIAALSADDTRLVLFDLAAGRWRDLLSGSETLISPNFTADGTGLLTQRGSAVIRVSVADGRVEPVASLEGIALVDAGFDAWTAVAPDDSPITLRETGGTTEVYALDVDWP